jgi:probable phosphoglycerate mutase
MPDVVLIRPGCTDFDDQKRIQGALDLPLNPRGQEQVQQVVRQLRDVPLDLVLCAPCDPCRATALAVSEECGAAFKEIADLRNLDYGLWQGLQVDDVRRKYPKVFKQWQESPETVRLPEGETVAEAMDRIRRALRKALKRRRRSVAIVASEPVATMIACALRGCRAELPESAPAEPERMIEFIRVDGAEALQAAPHGDVAVPLPAANGNGSATNGAQPAAQEGTAPGRNGSGDAIAAPLPETARPGAAS